MLLYDLYYEYDNLVKYHIPEKINVTVTQNEKNFEKNRKII
jgi:hypothetical protein